MSHTKRVQPRQIRMSDETKAKIDALAQELGCSTAETIEMLVNEHGMNLMKQTVPEQAAAIDQFKVHTRGLLDLFENSVALFAGAKDAARLEFANQLETQALAVREQERKYADVLLEMEKRDERIKELSELPKQIEALKSTIADRERAIADRDRIITDKEAIIAGHANLEVQLGDALTRNNQMSTRVDALQEQLAAITGEAAIAKSEAQLATQALANIREQLIHVQSAADKHAAQYEKQIAVLERQIDTLEKSLTEKEKAIIAYEERLGALNAQADENLRSLRKRGESSEQ